MEENNTSEKFQMLLKKQKADLKKNFIIKLSVILFVFCLVFLYFILPISHASNTKIKGNKYLTKNDVLKLADVKSSNSLYLLSDKKVKEQLSECPLISNTSVCITPFGMKISFEEKYPAFYTVSENLKTYYFNDGTLIDDTFFSNENEIVTSYIQNHLDSCYKTEFNPEKLTRKELSSFLSILDKTSDSVKERIISLNYAEDSAKYSVYLKGSKENVILNIVFECNSNAALEALPEVFSEASLAEIEDDNSEKMMEEKDGNKIYLHEIISISEDASGNYIVAWKKAE